MASKRRNMFHKNKTQETTEKGSPLGWTLAIRYREEEVDGLTGGVADEGQQRTLVREHYRGGVLRVTGLRTGLEIAPLSAELQALASTVRPENIPSFAFFGPLPRREAKVADTAGVRDRNVVKSYDWTWYLKYY
ncbi:hypothetical protein AAG570_010453 [Ranatra chinensis]|uniref:Uncharacterized protein n=1 Tax=Ranatra chinensis TaxID=642074 RepID=A0ABD0YMK8_9HEMI